MTTPLHTDTFLPYMRDVSRCERSLQDLSAAWRLIEASAKMNCAEEAQGILPIMKATQTGFGRLERELVVSLVGEKLSNVQSALRTQARFSIDIVVRNLFERTADVGFLATDSALCAFAAGQQTDADAVRTRLLAYRQKYTVYDEILLLDAQGTVLVQLDSDSPVECSTDPLIAQTLASDGYVETFRASDLRPGHTSALLYSRSMRHPDTGAVIGLLVLSFDFHREMHDIFRSHRDEDGRTNLMLLDEQGTVIASADERWISPGSRVPVHTSHVPQVFIHEGREYLVQTCPAIAYQDYPGPTGWQGHAMIPLNLAFSAPTRQALATLDSKIAAGLLTHARRFSPPLFEVMRATKTIQRVVWNGQIISAGQYGDQHKLKVILEQISETGSRSNAVFFSLISDMYETVLDARLGYAASQARLLVDLLDRNLYERANDCRWWSLTPQLRHTLAQPTASRDLPQITGILDYVNSLYTVYRTLFVYDSEGGILAASRQGLDALDGKQAAVPPALLQRVQSQPSDQAYSVSALEASPFTPGETTYTYHAAIRHPDDDRRVIGGIGIVFETARELQAMLASCIGEESEASAFFVDRRGTVMASTHANHPAGSALPIPAQMLLLDNGQHQASVVEFEGQYAVLGCAASPGYREFKVSDGYRDDVLSVVLVRLGAVQTHASTARGRRDAASGAADSAGRRSDIQSYATFWSGLLLLALPASAVVEAVPAALLSAQTAADSSGRVGLLPPMPGSAVQHLVWVFDLAQLLGSAPTAVEEGEIVLVRHGLHTVGLLVDGLHGVPEFAPERRRPSPLSQPGVSLVTEIIQNAGQHPIIQLIDLPALMRRLLPPALPQ